MEGSKERFGGIIRLYGADSFRRLQEARVLVIGLGGVGSWAVEALARSGIGTLGLVDLDDICLTNINRQIHATEDTIGKSKGKVLEQRAKSINPDIRIERIDTFYTPSTAESILTHDWNIVFDAIDSLSQKTHLIATCKERKIPIVTVGGAGGRVDPLAIKKADLSKTEGDRLLMLVRKQLRQRYDFPRNLRKKFGITAIYSDERPRFPWTDGTVCENREAGTEGGGMNCDTGLGAVTHLTASMAFVASGEIIQHLIEPNIAPTS